MAATIKDVARLAGVSPSTVSRVLNQKGVISDETKQKIASAMEQLKYVPNDIARSFANGSTHAISLVIDISDGTAYANNFFNNTVFGIETAAHQNDYNLIITNGAAAFGGISSVERLIAGKKVDGVVLPISLVTGELLRRIEDLSVPCVILGRSEEVGAEANWVDINNVQAGRRAVRLLLERGYKRSPSFRTATGRFSIRIASRATAASLPRIIYLFPTASFSTVCRRSGAAWTASVRSCRAMTRLTPLFAATTGWRSVRCGPRISWGCGYRSSSASSAATTRR